MGRGAGKPDTGPLAGWPAVDGDVHLFRVRSDTLRSLGQALLDQASRCHGAPGGPDRLSSATRLGAAWGSWNSAVRTRAACEEAMGHLATAYQTLLADYHAAGHLLLQTAQTYEQADARSRVTPKREALARPAGSGAVAAGDAAPVRLPVSKDDIVVLTPAGYDRRAITRMLDAVTPSTLYAAASAWGGAASHLTELSLDLKHKAYALAQDWDGMAAAACQRALQRIHDSAVSLAGAMTSIRNALWSAAAGQDRAKQALNDFRSTKTSTRLYGKGHDMESARTKVDELARGWLKLAYDGYRQAWLEVPDSVSYHLPGLASKLAADQPPPGEGAHPRVDTSNGSTTGSQLGSTTDQPGGTELAGTIGGMPGGLPEEDPPSADELGLNDDGTGRCPDGLLPDMDEVADPAQAAAAAVGIAVLVAEIEAQTEATSATLGWPADPTSQAVLIAASITEAVVDATPHSPASPSSPDVMRPGRPPEWEDTSH